MQIITPTPPMNIFIWNCNGASSRPFNNTLKDLLCRHKPEIVALLETRCSDDHANTICNQMGFYHWVREESLGCGIWILWKDNFYLRVLIRTCRSIFSHKPDLASHSCLWHPKPNIEEEAVERFESELPTI